MNASFRLIVISLAAYAFMTTFAFCDDFHESDSQVWKVGQRRWTIQDEYHYGKWIEATITEDFFIRHDIRVDCADVPYAIRWIYARIHHLPAAARTLDNRLIGHWSKDWARLPTHATWEKDRRFRAALMAMLSSTSTMSLPLDTYPIRIAADSVTAGTVFLIAEDHAGIVSRIVTDGSTTHPVQTFEAGMPTRIQRLHLRNVILPDPRDDHVSGFLKFRWPIKTGGKWHYLSADNHPFYSQEQYSSDFTKGYADYLEAVEKRIDPKVYDPNEKAGKIMNTLTRQLIERIPVVLDGNKKCHEIQCPEGSRLWEIYSTPDRDEFITVMIDHLEEIIRKSHLDRDAILGKMEKLHLQISPDRYVTLRYVFQNSKWLSSDPAAAIEARWGLNKCGMIAIHRRSARESIAFIQKKYRGTDPRFAERSIRAQQRIVDEMTLESRKNNCAIDSIMLQ